MNLRVSVRKPRPESNYRVDNDIFGTKSTERLQDKQYYKKAAREFAEKEIDSKMRVSKVFI
jgi:hypothetical protein